MAPNDAEVRKMNLIDMLADDFDGVEEPPEYAVQLWTEDQIRLYFESGGATEGLPEPQGGGDTSEQFATLLAAALAKQAVVPKPAPGGVLRGVGRQVADAQKKARVVLCNWTGNRGGAGSAHSFTQWAKLPDAQVLEFAMPGRGTRGKEPCAEQLAPLVQSLADALMALTEADGLPLVLFGFSFGALVAFETALQLQRSGFPPLALVVASAEAPSWGGRGGDTRSMPMESFEAMLRAKGGTDIIINDPAMKAMYMPVIRSDMLLEESYVYQAGDVLDSTAIVAFYGEGDNSVDVSTAGPWMDATTVGAPYSRTQALKTSLVPGAGGAWLSDWYLCQDKDTAATMATAIASMLNM